MKKKAGKLLWVINGVLSLVLVALAAAAFVGGRAQKELKPYVISFGDNIAIRCLNDGRIDATVDAYEKADWAFFRQYGSTWAEPYTAEEYKALMAEYDSEDSFAAMQAARDYVDVSANAYGTLAAVHADGTVAFNKRAESRYHTSAQDPEWRNVKEMELGAYTVLALKKDGTVAAKASGETFALTQGTKPETWQNIRSIANDFYAVGLREDGTVCCAGSEYRQEFDVVSEWTDIVQVDTSWEIIAGLRSNGTVLLAGSLPEGIEEACGWENIVKVAVGYGYAVGLKADGTLVCTSPQAIKGGEKLKNVADVYANRHYVLAVLKNGNTRLLGKPEEKVYDGAWPARNWTFPR